MPLIKMYRVEYTFRQPRHKDTFTVVNEKVISDSQVHAVRDGLADGLILQHLLKHITLLLGHSWVADK